MEMIIQYFMEGDMVYMKKSIRQFYSLVSVVIFAFILTACQSEVDRKEQADFHRIQLVFKESALDDEDNEKWRQRMRQTRFDAENLEAYLKDTINKFELVAVGLHDLELQSEKGAQMRQSLLHSVIMAINAMNRALQEKDNGFQSAEVGKSVITLQKAKLEMEKQRILLEKSLQKKWFWFQPSENR